MATVNKSKLFLLSSLLFLNFSIAQNRTKISLDSVYVSLNPEDSNVYFKQRFICFHNNECYDYKAEGPLQIFPTVELFSVNNDSVFSINHLDILKIKNSNKNSFPTYIENKSNFDIKGDYISIDSSTGERKFKPVIIRKKNINLLAFDENTIALQLQFYYATPIFSFVENQQYPDTLKLTPELVFSKRTHIGKIGFMVNHIDNNTVEIDGIKYKKVTSYSSAQQAELKPIVKTMYNYIKRQNFSLIGIR